MGGKPFQAAFHGFTSLRLDLLNSFYRNPPAKSPSHEWPLFRKTSAMLTQPSTPSPAPSGMPQNAAAPSARSFWQRADDITGFALFMLIVVGGVVTPFALYFYGLLFR